MGLTHDLVGLATFPKKTRQSVRCSYIRNRKGRSAMKRVCMDNGVNPTTVTVPACVPSSFTVMLPCC